MRRIWCAAILVMLGSTVLVGLPAQASAAPAIASAANPVTGVATCASDGTYHFRWTISNLVGVPVRVANMAPGPPYMFPSDGPTQNPIPAGGTSIVRTIGSPGSFVGTATFAFGLTWMVGDQPFGETSIGTVEVDGSCVPIPIVEPGTAAAAEGNSGSTPLEVPVSLSNPSPAVVTVPWSTVNVAGAAGYQADPASDYVAASGTVTFNPGETTKTVTIQMVGDTRAEADEYVVVTFHDPTNAVMGGVWGLGFGTIANDDPPTVLAGHAAIAEGDTGTPMLQVPVSLSVPSTRPVTVQWTTTYVTGAPGHQADPASDYVATSGTVTFNPGETAKSIAIQVKGDRVVETDEYVVVSFHDPTNAVSGGFWGLGFGIIANDD